MKPTSWKAPAGPLLALLVMSAALLGCGAPADDSVGASADTAAEAPDVTAEKLAHYENYVSLPADVQEAVERGEITAEEIDARIASGEFRKFFTFGAPDQVPADLVWLDGMELDDLGDPDAVKGGTKRASLQDFPRTLRRVGPDANGGFRPMILDYVVMQMAQPHPNQTEIVDSNRRYFPGIADRWAVDMPNKRVFVHINPAARFSDGEAVTVDDVFFMFFFYHSDYIQAPWYNNYYKRQYANVTRYDEHTFSVTFNEAKPDLLMRALELEPLPEHFFRELGPDYVERFQWRFVPTTGAYVVRAEDVRKGRSIALTRLDDWWAKDNKFWRNRYNYDRIVFTVIRDLAKSFDAFRKGELDQFGLTLAEYWYEKLADDDSLVANGYVSKATFFNQIPRPTYGFWINQSRPLLNDRNVRVGINFATNFEKVINEYFRGDYTRMRTTADGFGEFTHPSLTARPFDIDKALESFALAGFVERGSDGILVNEAGQRLSFTLSTGYQSMKDVLTILAEEARAAGLELRVEVLDGTAAWKKVQEKQHDIHFSAFAVSVEMYPRYWETYHSVNAYDVPYLSDGSPNPDRKVKVQTNNLQTLANPEIDALIEQYRASEDAEEMKALAFRLEELLQEDASFVPGFVIPFYRVGYWNWVKYPDDFNVKQSRGPGQYFVDWTEPGERERIEAAQRAGESLPASIETYDQYREAVE